MHNRPQYENIGQTLWLLCVYSCLHVHVPLPVEFHLAFCSIVDHFDLVECFGNESLHLFVLPLEKRLRNLQGFHLTNSHKAHTHTVYTTILRFLQKATLK